MSDAVSRARPLGSDYDPTGNTLSLQEAADRINALCQAARSECYLPEDPMLNKQNAGRVRALAQALTLLERAGLVPYEDAVQLTDQEAMEES